MIIDAHIHCWQLSRGDYTWLTPDLTPLYQDYTPSNIAPIHHQHGVTSAVLTQAAPTIEETHYLLSLADKYPFISGVVGWANFDHSDVELQIRQLKQHAKLKGIRPMIQDIPDKNWMLSNKVSQSLSILEKQDLAFEALVKPKHLKNLVTVLEKHPNLRTIIDHSGKPDIQNNGIQSWKTDIKNLATSTSALCKVSGLLTEAPPGATLKTLRPYLDWLFECFSPSRLVFGSDWPVINLCSTYTHWVDIMQTYTKDFSESDKALFWAGNAQRIYQLD